MSETSVLLGLFDGVHLGHRSAIDELLRQSGRKLVFTFDSGSVTSKGERGLLMTDWRKREELLRLGADGVISKEFSEIRDLSPEDFLDRIITGELHADRVICGENFRFGRGGSADAGDMQRLCAPRGIDCRIVPLLYIGGEAVSSTRIRGLIESGRIEEANSLLGYEYGFEGEVEHGFRIGSELGIKTLNLRFDLSLVLPKKGVYASEVTLSGQSFGGVTNVGTRPTVHNDGRIVVETHILGYSGDAYGEYARVGLKKFLREEKRFGSKEELRQTVAGDIKAVKELFEHE